jgi:hypothetical protein
MVGNLIGSGSMVLEHSLHHPKVEGSHPTHGTDREKHKMLDLVRNLIDSCIMVEEHQLHHPKVEGSNPTSGVGREELTES